MKVDELRVLEADELGGRLRAARRELYELRFKHAVGQLENSSQISKVRHDIARIMTVLHERDFGILASVPVEQELVPVAAAKEEKEKPKRAARKKTEETS
jgi:large subunit ribosomal protein L29